MTETVLYSCAGIFPCRIIQLIPAHSRPELGRVCCHSCGIPAEKNGNSEFPLPMQTSSS